MKRPILSITIPTKNRYNTLVPMVEGILAWSAEDFELVIQDNSDRNSDLTPFLKKYESDTRLKYFYEEKYLSAPENCELAILNSTGEYVCFLGDDDGLLEESIRFCHYLKDSKIQSASINVGIYAWPDLKIKYYDGIFNGKLRTPKRFTGNIYEIDIRKELITLLERGAEEITKIPKVYKGFVAKKSLDNLRDTTGTYFPGPVPDMSNAIGLIPFVSKHVFLDFPLTTSGGSSKSMTGKGAQKSHHGNIKDEKSLPKNTLVTWSKELPLFWSAQTIWAEGAFKALERTGQGEMKKHFNFSRNMAACLVYVPKYRKLTLKKIKYLKQEKLLSYSSLLVNVISIYLRRIRTLVTFNLLKININITKYDLLLKASDVKIAMENLESYVKTKDRLIDYKEIKI